MYVLWRKFLDLIQLDLTCKIILEEKFVKLNKRLLKLKLKSLELRLQD
jgi:hypothetical protein